MMLDWIRQMLLCPGPHVKPVDPELEAVREQHKKLRIRLEAIEKEAELMRRKKRHD